MPRKYREPNFDIHCYYCYGHGYVQRLNLGPLIKCIACDGSGRAEDWRAWQERESLRADRTHAEASSPQPAGTGRK